MNNEEDTEIVDTTPYTAADAYGEGYADAMRARRGGDAGKKKPVTIEDVRNMTPDQINKNWDDVSSILASSDSDS